MTNYADTVSDVEKVKEEGLKTEEEVKNWAMKHGYGLAVLDEFVAEWQGKPKVVEVAPEPEPEPAPEPVVEEVKEEVKEEAVEEVKPAVKTKKSLFGKN